jgi:hypothetical protein
MKSFTEKSEDLIDKVGDYANTSLDLIKLKLIQKFSEVIAGLTSRLLFVLFLILFSLFINIGLALFIGKILHETYLGFLVVSFFYLLLAVMIHYFKQPLIHKPMGNAIIEQMLDKLDVEDIVNGNEERDEK